MSFLEKAVSGIVKRPRKILIYGAHAVGKTTWAARFPKPIILSVEDGSCDIDCTRILPEHFNTPNDVLSAVHEASRSQFETIVIDSGDWFERMIELDLIESGFKMDFGKGAVEIARRFQKLLELLDKCVQAGKTVIIVAHEETRTATDIYGNQWDRIQPKLTKRVVEATLEWADEILHACYETFVREEEGDFGKKTGVASTTGQRILKTKPHPSYVAACRLKLPPIVNMDAPITPFLTATEQSDERSDQA